MDGKYNLDDVKLTGETGLKDSSWVDTLDSEPVLSGTTQACEIKWWNTPENGGTHRECITFGDGHSIYSINGKVVDENVGMNIDKIIMCKHCVYLFYYEPEDKFICMHPFVYKGDNKDIVDENHFCSYAREINGRKIESCS